MWKRGKSEADNDADGYFVHTAAQDADGETLEEVSAAALLRGLNVTSEDYARVVVDRIMGLASQLGASDLHLDATPQGHLVRLRIDGNLLELGVVPAGERTSIVSRLKALAGLVTYRSELPQEGRLELRHQQLEARLVTLPTMHGERIVVRFGGLVQRQWMVADLGLDADTESRFHTALASPAGVILITGPVGSGKTTTAYAACRTLMAQGRQTRGRSRCVVTLEDPIECELPGVAQSQIEPHLGFDWSCGLKALLRQDPEVMLIGEVRDAETAQVAFRAAMTGQLVLSTMHARNLVDSLIRLIDLQVPSQHVLAGLQLTLCQRLIRRRCPVCATVPGNEPTSNTPAAGNSLQAEVPATVPADATGERIIGCEHCEYSGYSGRLLIAESLGELTDDLARAVCSGAQASELQRLAIQAGMTPLAELARQTVERGETTLAEVARHVRALAN
jgi:general secretion pathway protein E